MEKLQNKIPLVRFPEFTDGWEHKVLNELLKESKKKNTDLKFSKDEVLSVSGELGIVNQIEHLGRSYAGESVHNYGVVEVGDIVYTKSPLKSNPYGIIKINKGKAGIVSTLYAVYKVNKKTAYGKFLDYYFSLDANTNRYLRPLVRKGAKNDMKINNEYVLNDRIFIPSVPEQKRITSLFSILDKKINQLKEKKTLLEEYKKGMLQKIFSQKIRFRDKNGKDFKDWKNTTLNKYIVEFKGKSNYNNEYPILTSSNKGLIRQDEYFDNEKLSNKDNTGFNVIPQDYITYRSRSDNRTFTFNINNLNITGVISTYYPVFSIKEGNNKFFIECLNYNKQHIGKYSVGTSQTVLSLNELKKIKFDIPCYDEQCKIADILQNIDNKVENVRAQLINLKEYKKALLQKMFCI